MFRGLAVLSAAACLALPAFAEGQSQVTTQSITVVSIPAADYERWQRMGFSTPDIFWAYNTAMASGRKVDDVFALRRAGRSWDQIAGEYRLPMHRVYGVPATAVAGERIEVTRGTGTVGSGMRGGMGGSALMQRRASLGHEFTAREYRRYRAQGFTPEEVYMIANASRVTGLYPSVFAEALYRGMSPNDIAREYQIPDRDLTRVDPEWRTERWAAEVRDPVFNRERLNLW